MKPEIPKRVKLFAGILYSNQKLFVKSLHLLQKKFGEIDYKSSSFKFNVSDYYFDEMGTNILRVFVSFEPIIFPDKISEIKILSNEIETSLTINESRKVNIDTGYLDYDKVVLASVKYNGNKIYLAKGVWADLTLHYKKGLYHPYPWSFPDFKSGIYNNVFQDIRTIFKKQRNK